MSFSFGNARNAKNQITSKNAGNAVSDDQFLKHFMGKDPQTQMKSLGERASTCRNITLDQIQIGDNRMFHNYCSLDFDKVIKEKVS